MSNKITSSIPGISSLLGGQEKPQSNIVQSRADGGSNSSGGTINVFGNNRDTKTRLYVLIGIAAIGLIYFLRRK